MRNQLLCLTLMLLLGFPSIGTAQFTLTVTDMSNGLTFGSNNSFRLVGVVGQTLVGRAQNANTWSGAGFWYAVRQGLSVTLDNEAESTELPSEYQLDQNYPNPFNPTTQIRYGLPKPGTVRIAVYNLLGQEVAVLVQGEQPAGWFTRTWNGRDHSGSPVASGIYLYQLQTPDFVFTRKMMLVK